MGKRLRGGHHFSEITTETHSTTNIISKTLTEKQLKCSSLPPGLLGPTDSKLSRSRSNAGSRSQDVFATLGEEQEDKEEKKSENSIFARLFPRRSAKKKIKIKQDAPPIPNVEKQVRYTTTILSLLVVGIHE